MLWNPFRSFLQRKTIQEELFRYEKSSQSPSTLKASTGQLRCHPNSTMGMSTLHFSVTEHTIPCQYIREYPHASKSDHAPLRLAIKEYQPLERTSAGSALMTIIATHGNGFPKETYEPLFDELYRALKGKIRGIWFADYSHQGASGILNERLQGDDRAYKVEHNPNARPSQTKKNDTCL